MGAGADVLEATVWNPFVRSMEGVLSRTPEGARFARFLKEAYEPALNQTTNELRVKGGFNPEQAFSEARRINRAYHFGNNDSLLVGIVNNARKKLGDGHANEVADALSIYLHETGNSHPGKIINNQGGGQTKISKLHWREAAGVTKPNPYIPPSTREQMIKHNMGYLFTPLVTIPHLSQPVNTLLLNGIGNMMKGIGEVVRDPKSAEQFALKTGALEAEIRYAYQRHANGLDTWVSKLFHHPGFNWVRKWQITTAAVAGKHAAAEAAEEFYLNGSKKAESLLTYFGINPQSVRSSGGKLTTDELLTAAYRSADESMFIRSGLRTPYAWDANATTRFMSMYRHYAFSEFKFITDTFIRAKQAGGWPELFKQVAIVGTMFPLAGEMVKLMEHAVRGQGFDAEDYQKNNTFSPQTIGAGKSEYIDALEHVAGIGVFMSMFRAAKRGSMSNWLAGPFFSYMGDIAQDVYGHRWTHLGRVTTSHLGPMGPWLANKVPALNPTKAEKKLQQRKAAIARKETRAYKANRKDKSIFDVLEGK